MTPPPFARGARIEVAELFHPWEGTASTIKPSKVSGYWVEVRDDRGDVWTVPAARCREITMEQTS